jgi:hypothetical protein
MFFGLGISFLLWYSTIDYVLDDQECNKLSGKKDWQEKTFLESPRSSTAGTLLLFNNSVRTAKKTQHFITKISLLTLFKEIIAVYTEYHMKHKQKCRFIGGQAGGTDIYH